MQGTVQDAGKGGESPGERRTGDGMEGVAVADDGLRTTRMDGNDAVTASRV